MGKRSKSVRAAKRKAHKRSVKEARRALYKSYAEQGRKGHKVKRHGTRAGSRTGRGSHLIADCGNPGCGRCYPQFIRRFGNPTHAVLPCQDKSDQGEGNHGKRYSNAGLEGWGTG